MPAKEIKELRKAGKLEEALIMALAEYQGNPNDIWSKRNLSWVLYDNLKLSNSPEQFELFLEKLLSITSLELPEDERMLFDQLSWQIGKMGFGIMQQKPTDMNKFIRLFDATKDFHFSKPSEAFSFMFKAFHKGLKESERYIQFVDWWGLNSFRPEDYQKEQLPNGKDIMALAEQAYIAYAKHLMPKALQNGESIFNKEKVKSFLPLLNNIIENYPQFQYPAYFKAKLLLALGERDTMLSTLLPFAKKKKNDFWVWEILSEAFPNEKEKVLACYCRALSCTSPEEMLVNLRQKMAAIFVQKKLYNEAKTEIELLVDSRKLKGYKIPDEVTLWQSQEWYSKASKKDSNKDFYQRYFDLADSLLFSDIKEEVIVVEFVNSDKKILNFISDKTRSGFFKYDRFIKKVEIGDKFLARIEGTGINTPYKVFTLKKTNKSINAKILRKFAGDFKINSNQTFGFVDDIFVEPRWVEKLKILDGVRLSGVAIISFNKKKNDWGWKAIKVDFCVK